MLMVIKQYSHRWSGHRGCESRTVGFVIDITCPTVWGQFVSHLTMSGGRQKTRLHWNHPTMTGKEANRNGGQSLSDLFWEQ